MHLPMHFHWRLVQSGEPDYASRALQLENDYATRPDVERQAAFCIAGEAAGITSVLVDFGFARPDSLMLTAGIAPYTKTMKFLMAIRSGIIAPTYFVQQINTLSGFTNGRLLLNIVAGHMPEEQAYYGDFQSHNDRYARTEEFLSICHAFWNNQQPVNFDGKFYKIVNGRIRSPFISPDRESPYIFIAGSSREARDLTISQGSCWMQVADEPEKLNASIPPVLAAGKEAGIRAAIIARPTREEAIEAAHHLTAGMDARLPEKEQSLTGKSDAVMINEINKKAIETEWPTPWLWTGALRTYGPAAIALVGTPEEIAEAIITYRKIGITQFIFSGWPKLQEMEYFGKEVLPLVRKKEKLYIEEMEHRKG